LFGPISLTICLVNTFQLQTGIKSLQQCQTDCNAIMYSPVFVKLNDNNELYEY